MGSKVQSKAMGGKKRNSLLVNLGGKFYAELKNRSELHPGVMRGQKHQMEISRVTYLFIKKLYLV
jgi:hypothetical protein